MRRITSRAHAMGGGKPVLLDLFCGAGGAAAGYAAAGFEVVGIDMYLQPHYPFSVAHYDLSLDEAVSVVLAEIGTMGYFPAVIHASPPCQHYSVMRRGRWQDRIHADLIGRVREQLIATGIPYVIENVVGSPLIDPLLLCGSMFHLQSKAGNPLRRHRLFELGLVNPPPQPECAHPTGRSAIGVYGNTGGSSKRDKAKFFGIEARKEAMGIDWMTGKELNQAIPPAYTRFLGLWMKTGLGL